MTRDQTLIVIVLLALYWMTRNRERVPVPVITTTEDYQLPSDQTIPGPGEPYDYPPDDYEYE